PARPVRGSPHVSGPLRLPPLPRVTGPRPRRGRRRGTGSGGAAGGPGLAPGTARRARRGAAPASAPRPPPRRPPLRGAGARAARGADRRPRPPRCRLPAGLLSAALVIALLVWALPWATGASWGEITGTLAALPAWSVPAMVLLGVGALLLEAVTVRAAMPGARWSGVLLAHPAAGATALAVPGGTVIGLGLMGWILRRSGLALPVVLTGIVAASLV